MVHFAFVSFNTKKNVIQSSLNIKKKKKKGDETSQLFAHTPKRKLESWFLENLKPNSNI